jgi:SAM-dependent methyltransferase
MIGLEHAAILNAGCGGNDYGISAGRLCVNLDLSHRQCRKMKAGVVADIEVMPFESDAFDAVLCVGAVINYSDPYTAVPELLRVTRNGGLLLIDFETSNTAELLFSRDWASRVSVVERNYAGRLDKTFLFSVDHVRRIIEGRGANIIATCHYHTTTALWHRVRPKAKLPRLILSTDELLSRLPGFRTISSNVIFACQKC